MKLLSLLALLVVFSLSQVWSASATEFYHYDRQGRVLKSDLINPYKCHYDYKHKTIFVIHGFLADSFTDYIVYLKESLLKNVYDANVIMVDWGSLASGTVFSLNRISKNVEPVANDVVNFINKNYIKPQTIHCIGSGLGAHVCGFIGKKFNGQLDRISGLDPTGLNFQSASGPDRLSHNDAEFVDIIHTSGDYGIKFPIGKADFYPNGGQSQPGCPTTSQSGRFCNVERAVNYFAESTYYYRQFRSVLCKKVDFTFGICTEYSKNYHDGSNMGYYAKNKAGIFYLNTNSRPPFALYIEGERHYL